MLRFPYLEELIYGLPPASLPQAAHGRWRPLVPITIYNPTGESLTFGRALIDSGADDTIFSLDVATQLGIPLMPSTGHAMRWRGQRYLLRFAAVELELVDEVGNALRWHAIIALSPAIIRYPLLGVSGCLEYFDVTFLGKERAVELVPNELFQPLAQQP